MLSEVMFPDPSDAALPVVDAERCVHSLLENASCRRCVDACPRSAWVIDDDMLGIDTERCDGCDLCVPVCPQEAMEGRHRPALRTFGESAAAFAYCDKADMKAGLAGWMPCLHALGLRELLRLHVKRVGYLITSSGNCATCPRGPGTAGMHDSLNDLENLLAAHKRKPLKHRALSPPKWKALLEKVSGDAHRPSLSRRDFFRGALSRPVEKLTAVVKEETGQRPEAPAELVAGLDETGLLPWVPVLDTSKCTGCDACIRLCPQSALMLDLGGPDTGPGYRIEARACSGCGVCRDICESKAIEIRRWHRPTQFEVTLNARRCGACGVDYHLPSAVRDAIDLCPVCRQVNHNAKLFQVLD